MDSVTRSRSRPTPDSSTERSSSRSTSRRAREASTPNDPSPSEIREESTEALCSIPRYMEPVVSSLDTTVSERDEDSAMLSSRLDTPASVPPTPASESTTPPAAITSEEAAAEANTGAGVTANAPEGTGASSSTAESTATENGTGATAADATSTASPDVSLSANRPDSPTADTTAASAEPTRSVSETPIHHGSGETKPQLPQPIIAISGNIRTPRVPSPPKEAIKRSAEIRTRTGSPPEMHHAKVEQAVLRVVEVSRTSQRQIIWRVNILAKDTRLSIDQMATELLGFVGHCVGQIRTAIRQAKNEIEDITDAELDHINTSGQLTDEALEQSRRDGQQDIHDRLFEQSEALAQANTEILTEFQPYLDEAQRNTMNISLDGTVTHVAPPPGGTASASPANSSHSSATSSSEAAVCEAPTGPQQNLIDLDMEIQGDLVDLSNRDDLGRFYASRSAPVYESQSARTQRDLDQAAVRQAESLSSFRAQFTNYALRLVTPIARDANADTREDSSTLTCAIEDDRHNLAASLGETGTTLMEKFDGVMRYLDNELGPRLTDGLNEAGGKAAKSFRDQAEMTERMMQNTAAGFADAYPQLVNRLEDMLPENQFLNIEELGPRLQKAMESAQKLPDQQYQAMNEQAELTLKQMRQAQQKQMQGLGESAQKSLQSVNDVVIATNFDITSFAYQVTGDMRAGGWVAIEGAAAYAERMATDLLKTKGETDGALNNLIRSFVESMNSAMDGFGGTYFQLVADFKESIEAEPTGVFATIENEIDTDLSSRSQKLNAQLTKPDTDTAIGLGLLSVATFGLAAPVAAGYLIYMDADDDEIFATIGNLQWPGPPALGQYFEEEGEYGNLEDRIRDCLSEDAAGRAMALFSADAATRAEGRLASVQNSFSLFGLDSDARQSLLQGMGSEERSAADPATMDSVSENIRNTWFASATDIRLNEAYLRGDYAAALSARMEAALNTARANGDDNIFQSVQNIETLAKNELALTGSRSFIEPAQIQSLTDRAMQDFASHRPGERRAAADISLTDARRSFITAATADRIVYYGEGEAVPMPVDQMVQNYVTEVVNGGWESPEALAARQAYEFQHAGRGVLGPSESDQVRFTRAFEDPRLFRLERELREHPERRDEIMPQLRRARREHDERMGRVLRRLHPELTEDEIRRAGGPTAMMARQAGELFAGSSVRAEADRREDSQYASELITGGRASLAAGVRISTRGTGTNEELLSMTYAGRSKAEIATARQQWQDRYGEDLDVMLGIKPRPFSAAEMGVTLLSPALGMFLYGGETSGDLAMELERASRGEPETDQDYIELAALTYAQQRQRGTGLLGSLTMSGTAEANAMDHRREEMGRTLLAEANRRRALQARDPNTSSLADAELPDDPNAVFLPDGRIHPSIAALVFAPSAGSGGRPGTERFLGDRSLLLGLSQSLELAGSRYKAELDRQESLMLSFVAILAVVATVVLMAFGVGFVLAGVISALGAGLLTMGIKSGMRGERYGWEEAAQDMAQTAIECAAAGVGGALGGGLGKANALARVGQSLVTRFGPIGGVIAREAIVGAVSSAAQVAIQDQTYHDGPGAALGRILVGGVKGAAQSAVSAGVSESLGARLNSRLMGGITQGETGVLARLGQNTSPIGRAMIKEGISEAIGSVAGEAVAIYVDVLSNQYQGGLAGALKRLGQAGLRDLVTASARGRMTAQHRATYNRLMAEARTAPHLSESDFHALQAAAKAAGEEIHSVGELHSRIQADHAALAQLPPEIRQHAAGLDSESLHKLVGLLQQGAPTDDAGIAARRALIDNLVAQNPQLNPRPLLNEIEAVSARAAAHDTIVDMHILADHHQQVRQQLTAELPEAVRNALKDMPVLGLDQLPPDQLAHAARLIASGRMDAHQADALLHAARAENPNLDAVTFLKNLHSATQSANLAQAAHTRILAKQRADVLRDIPDEAQPLFARLPDEAIGVVRQLLDQGHGGTAEQHAALLQQVRALHPDIDSQQFKQWLEQAASHATARQTHERMEQRTQREQRMTNVPEKVRTVLSVLPDDALIELHLRQMVGNLSPASRLALEQAALRENPALDLNAFHAALDEAVSHGTPIRPSAADAAKMQRELVAAIPESQRHKVENTPIIVMPDADFASYTRSGKGDAVTVMINGRAVIILREGADISSLREEGIHALQSQDPKWATHFGALNEAHLRHWDDLPLEQQMALYRNKIELEIDAHQKLVEGLNEQIRQAQNPDELERLKAQLEMAEGTLKNLTDRMSEVDGISPMQRHLMTAGVISRPQWLDQPARLFEKKNAKATGKTFEQLVTAFTRHLADSTEDVYRNLMQGMDIKQLRKLDSLGLAPEHARRVLIASKNARDVYRLISDLHDLHNALPASKVKAVLSDVMRLQDFSAVLPTIKDIAKRSKTPAIAAEMITIITQLGSHYSVSAQKLVDILRNTNQAQQANILALLKPLGSDSHRNIINHIHDISALLGSLKYTNKETQEFIFRIAEAAQNYHQPADILNQTQRLLAAVINSPKGKNRDTVLEHIGDIILRSTDIDDGILDIRAAARRLSASGTLPKSTLAEFARRINAGESMAAKADQFQLRLADALEQWPSFANKHKDFVRLLDGITPKLDADSKALLARMEPWFSHLVRSPWFAREASATGMTPQKLKAKLISEILRIGLRGATGVADEDTFNHIMQEMRLRAVETLPTPNWNKEVREQMRLAGVDPASIKKRDADFMRELQRARKAGLETPEVHLETLMRQRLEYQAMLDIALKIAQQRFPTDMDEQRRFYNELKSGLQQKVTETTGEIAATRALLNDKRFRGMELMRGFEQGTGFDQVWVRRNNKGEIIEILIVEAKGPGATTQNTKRKGAQMSAEWIVRSAEEMLFREGGGMVGHLILRAIQDGHPPISGVVIQAKNAAGDPGAIHNAPGTKGPNARYPTSALRLHNAPFEQMEPQEISKMVQDRINADKSGQYRFIYTPTEVRSIVNAGRAKGLTDADIIRLMMEGAKKKQPRSAADLLKVMSASS